MKKAIVTGGAGFIGSYMTKKLIKNGYYVFVIDNLFRGKKENIISVLNKKQCELIQLDLVDSDSIKSIENLINNNTDIDLIIHYAAINGTQYFYDLPQEVAKVNSIGTYNLMEALVKAKKSLNPKLKLFFASTSETYGEPFNLPTTENDLTYFRIDENRDSYAVAKMMSEFYVKLYSSKLNINYIILRIFNVYGPKMVGSKYGQVVPELIARLKTGEYPLKLIGSGDQKRSFIYISDHIELTWKLINSSVENSVINLGCDEEISIRDLAFEIMKQMNINPQIETTSERSGDHKRRKPDITKLLSIVGEYEFLPLHEGLKKCING